MTLAACSMPTLFQMGFLSRLTAAEPATTSSPTTSNTSNSSTNTSTTNSAPAVLHNAPAASTVVRPRPIPAPERKKRGLETQQQQQSRLAATTKGISRGTSLQEEEAAAGRNPNKRPRLSGSGSESAAAAAVAARDSTKPHKQVQSSLLSLSSRPKLFVNGLLNLHPGRSATNGTTAPVSTTSTLASASASTSASTSNSASTSSSSASLPSPELRSRPPTTPAANDSPPTARPQFAGSDITASDRTAHISSDGRIGRAIATPLVTGARLETATPAAVDAVKRREHWNEVRATPDTIGTQSAGRTDDKRALRSHDGGSRSRSELAQYFPNWDDIVSNEPQPEEPLTAKTCLRITEEAPKTPSTPSRRIKVIGPPTSPTQQTPSKLGIGEARVLSPSTSHGPSLSTFRRIDFSAQLAEIPKSPGKDPLSDEHFRLAHQRGERQEKQLRNIEKEKAQHEKVQLERLYEGLLGHDWLRVMGISGITDTEKKSWERKRDWVLREVKTLLDKFERYREEEKRLRMEKERQMEDSEDDEGKSEDDEEDGDDGDDERRVADTEEEEEDEAKLANRLAKQRKRRRILNDTGKQLNKSSARPVSSSSATSPAARQSQPDALPATTTPAQHFAPRSRKLTGIDVTPLMPLLPPAEEKPFVSFFDKPHLRAAAMAGNRRGRLRFAFGHAVPELDEYDFTLPRDMVTEEARRASARMRRLRRRTKE